MGMCDTCGDNRFELIEKYKRKLLDATNIEDSPEEMAVIDNILFRFWQMGWLNLATDTISRQDAIALLEEAESARLRGDILLFYPVMLNGLKKLPSAQPDVPDTSVGDMISRQAAKLKVARVIWEDGDSCYKFHDKCVDCLDDVPSAQQWISCSERMPEEHEWIGTKKFGTTISNEVYVTFEAPNGERFAKHISFQNGKLSSVDEQRMKVWYKGAKPIAWCPLPEPWKGEQNE